MAKQAKTSLLHGLTVWTVADRRGLSPQPLTPKAHCSVIMEFFLWRSPTTKHWTKKKKSRYENQYFSQTFSLASHSTTEFFFVYLSEFFFFQQLFLLNTAFRPGNLSFQVETPCSMKTIGIIAGRSAPLLTIERPEFNWLNWGLTG